MINCLLICLQLSFSTPTLFRTHLCIGKSVAYNGARSSYIRELTPYPQHIRTHTCKHVYGLTSYRQSLTETPFPGDSSLTADS